METKYVRVPFDIEMAKKITNGKVEGKVVTRDDGNARIICWDAEGDQPIIALIKYHDKEYPHSFCLNGLLQDGDCLNGDLMLEIPEYMTFKDGDVLYVETENNNNFIFINKNGASKTYKYVSLMNGVKLSFEHTECCYCEHIKILRFATESEKQKLIDALKASKEPDAKEYLKRFFNIEVKPECEFKPKDWVLIRDNSKGMWCLDIYSHKVWDKDEKCYHYYCVGGWSCQCIPYNDQTKHLLGINYNWTEERHRQGELLLAALNLKASM